MLFNRQKQCKNNRSSRLRFASGLATIIASTTWMMPASSDTLSTPGFDQTLTLQGIDFRVASPNNSSLSPVTFEVSGLALGSSTTLERDADGTVTAAHVADLNSDGKPEIYVFTTSAGSGSYGGLIAYAVNNSKNLSAIHLPPFDEHDDAAHGYSGHDTFTITDNKLLRHFPIYNTGDSNAAPSGEVREITYQLDADGVLHSTAIADSPPVEVTATNLTAKQQGREPSATSD